MTTLMNAPERAHTDIDFGAEAGRSGLVMQTARVRREDERAFALMLVLSYPFFLVLAIGARLVRSGGQDGASVFVVAAEAARSTLAIALNQ